MKIYKSFLILVTLTMVICCHTSNKNVVKCALFFNPAQAFYADELHFIAKLNDSLILDTLVKNTRIDNSKLLKCLNFKSSSTQILSIDIDGKVQQVHLNAGSHDCLNVFVGLDDHFLLYLKQDQIEKKKMNSGKSNNLNGRQILDSLRLHAKNHEYDSILVNIKTDRCLCK